MADDRDEHGGAARGRDATRPSEMTGAGWKDIFWRVLREMSDDRITLIAAGATFYLLLALFPALAAFASIYGFVASPGTIAEQIAFLGTVLPSGGLDLIQSQLESLAGQDQAALSFGFVSGLLVALWSSNNGIKTLFEALNVAYEEREKRSFLKLNAVSFLFTIGAMLIGVLFIVSVGIVPAILGMIGLGGWAETLISLMRWPVLFVASAIGISILYRFGPSRERPKWRWVSWGSIIATAVWLVASIIFSWYLANFANYNATYGSLGAVIGFMMWTWISVVILLAGAEFNAELEHQTMRDSTTGEDKPLGERGATMADTIGKRQDEPADKDEDKPAEAPGAAIRRGDAGARDQMRTRPRSSAVPPDEPRPAPLEPRSGRKLPPPPALQDPGRAALPRRPGLARVLPWVAAAAMMKAVGGRRRG